LRVAVVGFAVREVLRCTVGRAGRQVERELATVTNTSRRSDPAAKITKTQT
jgi:hypothetical protein